MPLVMPPLLAAAQLKPDVVVRWVLFLSALLRTDQLFKC